jgi:hypothetical protein
VGRPRWDDDPRPFYIYALVENDTGDLRYVGRTQNPKARLHRHEVNGYHLVSRWRRDLRARGADWAMIILHTVVGYHDACALESREIASRALAGIDLLNKVKHLGRLKCRAHRFERVPDVTCSQCCAGITH